MNYEDDFYENISEFDQEINDFRNHLMENIKKEFVEEMDSLRKENAELQDIKDNWESLKQSYATKERDLIISKSNALSEARSLKLSELLSDHKFIMYKVDTEYIHKPKCNNCDNNRKLHFVTPGGRDALITCDCDEHDVKYIPSEYAAYEFKLLDYRGREFLVWYKRLDSDKKEYFHIDESSYGSTAKITYKKDMEFDKLDKYETYFENRNDCKKYCDWLNKLEKVT